MAGPAPAGPETAGRLAGGKGCKIEQGGLVARCRIGRGEATVIADADFLNVEAGVADENLDLLIEELDRLDSR